MIVPFPPPGRQGIERRPSTADIARALAWMARELRAERRFPWYRSRRPRAFVITCPPAKN
jgi:hypothetical protein